MTNIRGSGGGGKSGGSGPTEAPNTLKSAAIAKFVDLLCEGPVKGISDEFKSIVIGKVPVQNPDDSYNYQGVSYAFLPGTSDQQSLPGFDGVASEFSVSRRVRFDTPVVYATQSADLTAIIATVNLPALTQQDKKTGDLNGSTVSLVIDVRNASDPGNAWVTVIDNDTIRGKNTAPYERSYRIQVEPPGPWQVRLRRLTADHDEDVTYQDKIYFSHVTEAIEHKIAYSDSAVIGIEIDAEQFGENADTREYEGDWALMPYPSNYDPETRVYTGVWDGTFSYGYTNNLAWAFRLVANHPRFGADIDAAYLDKWNLYALGKYCDELVPDGFGGTEPRFTFNGVISTRTEAYKILQQMASMMRSIVFYGAGSVVVRQDRPMEPERNIYTPANIKGDFNYGSTALRARHNAAIVQWTNPTIGYDSDYSVYEHREAIIKYGYNPLSMKSEWTTSEGQAYRAGKWAVLTELFQTETVQFTAGWDSADVLPGDVIEIADPHYAAADFGGRIVGRLGNNLLDETQCALHSWAQNGLDDQPSFAAGPFGARNLQRYTAVAGYGPHIITTSVSSVPAGRGVFSFYVRRGDHRFCGASVYSNTKYAYASFDLEAMSIRFHGGSSFVSADLFYDGPDTIRCVIEYTSEGYDANVYIGPDTETITLPVFGPFSSWVGNGEEIYIGTPQFEIGELSAPEIVIEPAHLRNKVRLDRDIDFTGAVSPEIHLMLLDGAYDDEVTDIDNTDRPTRRKIQYFSSAVTGYDPVTQVLTFLDEVPENSLSQDVPTIWIFSKDGVQPTMWKVISIEESDKKDYTISAVNYSAEKFTELDQPFLIREPDAAFSDLPSTRKCDPPSDLKVDFITNYSANGQRIKLMASWTPTPDKFVLGYVFTYQEAEGNKVAMPITATTAIEVGDLRVVDYECTVYAINRFGVASPAITYTVNGDSVSVVSRTLVGNIRSDRGDTTFVDKDIPVFWDSVTPVNDPVNSRVSGSVVRPDFASPGSATIVADQTDPYAPTLTFGGSFLVGDQIVLNIGYSTFYTEIAPGETVTDAVIRLTTAIETDERFTASRVGNVITVGYVTLSTNATAAPAHTDPGFDSYRIQVYNAVTNTLLRTETVKVAEYWYTYANNMEDTGDNPVRSVRFDISVLDIMGNYSDISSATLTNPPPELAPVSFFASSSAILVSYEPLIDPDFSGILVWVSDVSGFTPGPSNLMYKDRGNPTLPLSDGTTYYFRYAFYDAFGTNGIIVSDEYDASTLPISTTSVTGPSAVYLYANSDGSIADGQLPKTFSLKRIRDGVDVSDTTTWSVISATGCSASIDMYGEVTITDFTNNGTITIDSTRDGVLLTTVVTTIKSIGAVGGAGVSTTTFNNPVNTSSYGSNYSGTISVNSDSSGGVGFSCNITTSVAASKITASHNIYAKWQWRVPAGTWADVDTETINDQPATTGIDGGAATSTDGYINFTDTMSGLTPSSPYEFRMAFRRATGTVPVYLYGTASVSGG